jgi:protein phosphatase 2C family protein 2/3
MQFQMEATSKARALSTDHKPSNPDEYKRIVTNGGYVYQTQTVMKNGMPTTQTQQVKQDQCPPDEDSDDDDNPFVGPYRVFPGRLSVCRTFGDCEAKVGFLGGCKGVVTCEPEIIYEKNGVHSLDYVLIGSDGIFDKLNNDTVNQIVWDITTKHRQQAFQANKAPSIHAISGLVADEILHASARKRSLDNLSIVFIAFQRFSDYINAF